MKISEIPIQSTITSSEIQSGQMLGMKNVYPEDDIPVYELQRFPLTAFVSDIGLDTTEHLIERMRKIKSDVAVQKQNLETLVSNVRPMSLTDVSAANLQLTEDAIEYDAITSQLESKFASPDEFQTAINNVYSALFTAVEDMMVQVFTTSMYARQYTPIIDEIQYSPQTTSD